MDQGMSRVGLASLRESDDALSHANEAAVVDLPKQFQAPIGRRGGTFPLMGQRRRGTGWQQLALALGNRSGEGAHTVEETSSKPRQAGGIFL